MLFNFIFIFLTMFVCCFYLCLTTYAEQHNKSGEHWIRVQNKNNENSDYVHIGSTKRPIIKRVMEHNADIAQNISSTDTA